MKSRVILKTLSRDLLDLFIFFKVLIPIFSFFLLNFSISWFVNHCQQFLDLFALRNVVFTKK
jgi:hypothetical protein